MKEEDKTKEEPVQGAGEMGQEPTELDTLEMQRKQLEEALRESEEKYHHLFEGLQEAAFVADVETELILDANRQAEALLGKSRYEIVGKHYLELYPPEKADEIRQMFAEHTESGRATDLELEVLRKDGKIVPVRLSASILTIRGKRISLALARDISRQKKAEQNLKQYRFIVESTKDIIFFKDLESRYLIVNPRALEFLGLPPEEVIGKNDYEVMPKKEEARKNVENDQLVFKTNKTKEFTRYVTGSDGKEHCFQILKVPQFDDAGNVIGLIGIATDVTERKQAEEALQQIEWLLTKSVKPETRQKAKDYQPPYGDLVEINTTRLLVDSVGKDVLMGVMCDYLDLLETCAAVYERNGDYASGIFSSGWCKFLDQASRKLCGTDDNREALESGKWHCHESCWTKSSKASIETGQPVDIECNGGMHCYSVPINAGGKVVGSVNFGYGDPPRDPQKLQEIAERYGVSTDELLKHAKAYDSRPPFIIDIAKNRLLSSAKLIGAIVEGRRGEEEIKAEKRKLEAYTESMVDGFSVADANGTLIQVNIALTRIHGYESPEEMIGKSFFEFIPKRELPKAKKTFMESLKNRESFIENLEMTGLKKDGSEFTAMLNIRNLWDEKGEFIGCISIVRDITERKKEEEVLKEYEKAVESSQELIAVLDRHYVYRLVNEAFLRYRCLNRDQVIGHTVVELVGEDVFETKIKPNLDRCLQGEIVQYDMVHRYPEVGKCHMQVVYYPLKSDGEEITGVVAVIRNVTSEKKIELMRECIISLFQLLSKSTTIKETMGGVTLLLKRYSGCDAVGIRLREGDDFPYFKTDGFPEEFVRMENSLCTRALGGQIVRDDTGNPVLECMCGNVICGRFDPAKPFFTEGGSFWTNSTTELLASTTEADRQAWTRDRCSDEGYESVALIPLGTEIETFGLLQLNDKRKGQFAPSDIAFLELLGEHLGTWLARKWGEKALRESEGRYRLLAENVKDVIWTTDMNLRITYISPSVTPVLGYTAEEVMGQSMEEAMTPASAETIRKIFAEELAIEDMEQKDLSRSRMIELEAKCKDGSTIWTEATVSVLRDEEGRAMGIVGVSRDVTERKEIEEDRVKVSKLESVAILAGGIAHDFNNLLMAILGNVSVAKMYANPGDKIFDRLADATKASLQAKSLTNQLLIFSKGGEPIKKVASIAELIKNSVEFALRGSKARCELSIPPDVYQVEVDEGQVGQVINNLILNADQAMPEGGVIEVRAENVTVEPKQHLPLKGGKYVKISIKDQGIGIPEEHIPKVFDPYFTTKQKGSGLGLSTAYSIIKNHEGHITLESKTGVGTTFYVYLPASEKEILKKKDVKEETIVGEGKILVVDDEEMVRDVTGNMLKLIGYKVGFARDGAEAIKVYKKAKKSGQPFDAIILDLTIPGAMGGTEAIKKLIEIDPQVKAIVSSGYSNDPVMANFSQYGFSGFLIKPYKIQELSEILQEVIMGKSE